MNAPVSIGDVADAEARFNRLRLLLGKLTAISQMMALVPDLRSDEVRILCAQIGLLVIDLTQTGIPLDPVEEMIRAWKQEQMTLLHEPPRQIGGRA